LFRVRGFAAVRPIGLLAALAVEAAPRIVAGAYGWDRLAHDDESRTFKSSDKSLGNNLGHGFG
jgi:hypothetical protein